MFPQPDHSKSLVRFSRVHLTQQPTFLRDQAIAQTNKSDTFKSVFRKKTFKFLPIHINLQEAIVFMHLTI